MSSELEHEHEQYYEQLSEKIRETVVKYFIEIPWESSEELALLLIDCKFSAYEVRIEEDDPHKSTSYDDLEIQASPRAFRYLRDNNWCWNEVCNLIRSCYPSELRDIGLRLQLRNALPGWDEILRKQLTGQDISNQGGVGKSPILDDLSLKYKSGTEVVMAKALRKAMVLFFPLPVAVVNNSRLEPDFLICHRGRWGILEFQADATHPSAARDHERSRVFKERGITCFEVFDWKQCHADADGVVRKFLNILAKH